MPHSVAALVRLSALLAARHDDEIEAAMQIAAGCAGPEAVEEAILQSYLFLGYPLALNAMARWRAVSGARPPARTAADRDAWLRRGEEVCGAVYGGQYERLRANVRLMHPDLESWMVEEGYGKVLGRSGLSLPERELCIVALLIPLDVPRQLYSHLRGALNVGASEAAVDMAVKAGLEHAEPHARQSACATWDAVRVASDAPRVASDAPRVASDAPRVASDAPRVASDAPRVASDAKRVASDAPRVASDAPRVASDAPRVASDAASALAARDG